MTTHSIHNSGESALDSLIAELQNSGSAERGVRSGKNAKLKPDVSFVPTGKAHAIGIEVKKTGKSVPQMRPLSYKPHVIWQAPGPERAAKWWVIPPHELLGLALNHPGQHCISSFECMNPGTPSARWEKWVCKQSDLAQRIESAFNDGEKSPFKTLAEEMTAEIRALYETHKARLRKGEPPDRVARV